MLNTDSRKATPTTGKQDASSTIETKIAGVGTRELAEEIVNNYNHKVILKWSQMKFLMDEMQALKKKKMNAKVCPN